MEAKNHEGERIPFDLTWWKFDKRMKTGGEVGELNEAVILSSEQSISSIKQTQTKPKIKRPPNHYENFTRNIVHRPSGTKAKVHALFIRSINNMKVIP